MNRIAFIIGENFVYWSSIIMTIAVAVAVCTFFALYLRKGDYVTAGATVVPLAMVLSLVLARLVHWYCRAESYINLESALTNYSSGGYALMGVFAGCFLAALLVRVIFASANLPKMLDCMALAGGAGIAVGRLASFFDTSARGPLVETFLELPWAYPVTNVVSGMEEYRVATFLLQSVIAASIFLVLLIVYLVQQDRGKGKDGDVCLMFLLCYGASQVAMDSTRYDSLFFRSNGFVSIVQVLGALAIGLALVVFSVRMVKNRGWKVWYLVLWLIIAALLGVGGYMEYYVQRHPGEAQFAYTVMIACLMGLVTLCLVIYGLAGFRKRTAPEDEKAAPSDR